MRLKLQISEVLFIISALATLFVQPFLQQETGFFVWTIAKVLYFIGLLYFGYNLIKNSSSKDVRN